MTEMELDGALEPPKANGEVIFEFPWQSRIFGMAQALCQQGLYTWDEFRAHLIREIGEWDAHNEVQDSPMENYQYFDHFLKALTELLQEKHSLDLTELTALEAEFANRPEGHDHDHDPAKTT